MWIFRELVNMARTSYEVQLLFLTSIIGMALFFERLWFYLRNRVQLDKVSRELIELMEKGDLDEIKRIAYSANTPFHNVIKTFIDNFHLSEDLLIGLVDASILRERERMTKYLNGLSTVAMIAPLLGLYGTVTGLIDAFHQISVTGAGGPEVVGRGISVALLTTMFGLAIAIPTLIVHNYFSRKSGEMAAKTDATIRELLILSYKSGVREMQ